MQCSNCGVEQESIGPDGCWNCHWVPEDQRDKLEPPPVPQEVPIVWREWLAVLVSLVSMGLLGATIDNARHERQLPDYDFPVVIDGKDMDGEYIFDKKTVYVLDGKEVTAKVFQETKNRFLRVHLRGRYLVRIIATTEEE